MVYVDIRLEDGTGVYREAECLEEVLIGLKKDGRFPSDIRGELAPAADLTFRWMRWEDGDPGIFFEVPDYLEDSPRLMGGMMTDLLDYITGRRYSLGYSAEVKDMLTDEDFILNHQPVCLDRMSIRSAAGDVYDLDGIYRDLVLRGELEPDKYVAFGWDDSDGKDRDTPYGLSKTFHVVTIPAFMDDPDVPRKAIEYMIWTAVTRLGAGPFGEPESMCAPQRLGPGIVWLYDLAEALKDEEED